MAEVAAELPEAVVADAGDAGNPPEDQAPVLQVPPVQQALRWIGFDEPTSIAIEEDLGVTLIEIQALTRDDIRSSQKSFAGLTIAAGRIKFGTRRTKFLLDFIDWSQDFMRIGQAPTLMGLNQETFIAALLQARKKSLVRASRKENAETQGKEASPGKLIGVRNWAVWILKLFNLITYRW